MVSDKRQWHKPALPAPSSCFPFGPAPSCLCALAVPSAPHVLPMHLQRVGLLSSRSQSKCLWFEDSIPDLTNIPPISGKCHITLFYCLCGIFLKLALLTGFLVYVFVFHHSTMSPIRTRSGWVHPALRSHMEGNHSEMGWMVVAGGPSLCQWRERNVQNVKHFVLYLGHAQHLTHNSRKSKRSLLPLQ